ncbi:MAG: GatB/YqeY domain-containing protein [Candidatus Omnitrophica bacterium]|nr:GatB/YqeY domain-containing protein [Candidatus Omnitrophota bacterium]MBU4589464.1 GatB/YqeY domain-containing protein [Candidatus Omnitrophota bacterium]
MGEFGEKIAGDLKGSIKNKDALRTSTLRMITASMQNLAIEKQVKELEDSDILKIISKQMKQRHDSIESFKKGGREDLVEKETKELEILKSYLPEQLSGEAIEDIVKKVIKDTGASSKADFGKVMKQVMQETKGHADGKTISAMVQNLLS